MLVVKCQFQSQESSETLKRTVSLKTMHNEQKDEQNKNVEVRTY